MVNAGNTSFSMTPLSGTSTCKRAYKVSLTLLYFFCDYSKRSAHDTVRRRVWKRKRVYTGKKRVIEEQNKYLIYVDSNVKLVGKHVSQYDTHFYDTRLETCESEADRPGATMLLQL